MWIQFSQIQIGNSIIYKNSPNVIDGSFLSCSGQNSVIFCVGGENDVFRSCLEKCDGSLSHEIIEPFLFE